MNYITSKPCITYRHTTSLRDSLVHSHFSDATMGSSLTIGTSPAEHAMPVTPFDTLREAILPGGVRWNQRHHVSCSTMGVIYLLQCPCQSYYVGKTSRPFCIRILEHISAAHSGYFRAIIGRHMALVHNYKFEGFKFLPLAVIPPSDRWGDWDQALLRAKSHWIFKLQADKAPGLNNSISFAPFL